MAATPLIGYLFIHQNAKSEFPFCLIRDMVSKEFEEKQANYRSLFGISIARGIL